MVPTTVSISVWTLAPPLCARALMVTPWMLIRQTAMVSNTIVFEINITASYIYISDLLLVILYSQLRGHSTNC